MRGSYKSFKGINLTVLRENIYIYILMRRESACKVLSLSIPGQTYPIV